MWIGKILTDTASLSSVIMNRPPINAPVQGVRYYSAKQSFDNRGSFTKIWSAAWEGEERFPSREFFYSDSLPGVLRGLHLQTGEAACSRYVSVLVGTILDVVLDLRPTSPTFLNFQTVEMDSIKKCTVHVPAGVAHGFQALESVKTFYISGENHAPLLDSGVNAESIGFKWPIKNSIRSARDSSLLSLSDWLQENR
jgi:dTDP-4-dehydrorhamnose 3,5-epimerase